MAGSAQFWPGPRMRAFFRSILAAEPGVDEKLAERLADRLTKRINRMLVWDPGEVDLPSEEPAARSTVSGTDTKPAKHENAPPDGAESEAPKVDATFDPFAFSVVVVLKRQGSSALIKRLESVTSAAHLHQIAVAQHLGVDKHIRSVKKLREAIVAGAEQRLADRRAAAS